MPSKDTISWRITKKTHDALEKWRKKFSEILGVDINNVTYKEAEIAMRICSENGKIKINTLRDIKLGLIK